MIAIANAPQSTVDGISAIVQYAGGPQGSVADVMQASLQIPQGVHPGGYVSVTLTVAGIASAALVWISIAWD